MSIIFKVGCISVPEDRTILVLNKRLVTITKVSKYFFKLILIVFVINFDLS